MQKFIGYHSSNTHNLHKNLFVGETKEYIEYIGDIISLLPGNLKNKLKKEIEEYNEFAEFQDKQKINLLRMPKKLPHNINDMHELFEQYKELSEMVDNCINGIIFIDEKKCRREFGNECYEVFLNGDDFFPIIDKLNDGAQNAKVYVYYNNTFPVLKKLSKL